MEQDASHTNPAAAAQPHARRDVILAGAAGLCAVALYYLFDPATHGFFFGCPLYERTGILCAGCGGQRALHALLHGRVAEALSLNLIAVLVAAPLLCYGYTAWLLRVFTRIRLGFPRATLPRVLATTFLCLAYSVLRNLPAFAWLAPP